MAPSSIRQLLDWCYDWKFANGNKLIWKVLINSRVRSSKKEKIDSRVSLKDWIVHRSLLLPRMELGDLLKEAVLGSSNLGNFHFLFSNVTITCPSSRCCFESFWF